MPKRPIQHQNEDRSRRLFSLIVPNHWVIRNKDSDYGIDFEIEIFDDRGFSTGKLFYVQIKSSSSSKNYQRSYLSIKNSTLDYHKKLPAPTLIVMVDLVSEIFYYCWSEIIETRGEIGKTKQVNYKFSDLEVLTSLNFTTLEYDIDTTEKFLKTAHIDCIPISFQTINHEKSQNAKELLESYIREHLPQNRLPIVVNLNNNHQFQVFINKNRICFEIGYKIIASISLDDFLKNPKMNLDSFVSVMCRRFIAHGCINFTRKLLEQLDTEWMIGFDDLQLIEILQVFNLVGDNQTTQLILEHLSCQGDNERRHLLQSALTIRMLAENEDILKNQQIEFLDNAINFAHRLGDERQIAVANYNMANRLRSYSQPLKALRYYSRAHKYWNQYCDRSYFTREIAGCFFLIGRYGKSASFYSHSLECEHDTFTQCLLAESEMRNGNFQIAKALFDKSFTELDEEEIWQKFPKSSIHEWNLLKFFCENVIKSSQNLTYENSDEIEICKNSPLSGLAWFNLGVTYSQHKPEKDIYDWQRAARYFLFAVICQSNDVEAMVNSTLCSLNAIATPQQKENEFLGFFHTMLHFFIQKMKQSYISDTLRHLASRSEAEFTKLFADMLQSISDIEDGVTPVIFRTILDDDESSN